jgi:hypothetical protein
MQTRTVQQEEMVSTARRGSWFVRSQELSRLKEERSRNPAVELFATLSSDIKFWIPLAALEARRRPPQKGWRFPHCPFEPLGGSSELIVAG